jgi:hypothetical protein
MPQDPDAPEPLPDPGSGAPSAGSLPVPEIAQALVALGCPPEKSDEMARQLFRRANQLSAERGWTHDAALAHLLRLMAGGWAAQARGIQLPPR